MLVGPLRLSILAGLAAFGAIGATLAVVGVGVPFLLAAALASVAAGLVQALGQRLARPPPAALPAGPTAEDALRTQLDDYRTLTATLRHDLRGVLSPALMMSDRLLTHTDPAVQRAGTAVVRSIERATALLATSKDIMQPMPDGPAEGRDGPSPDRLSQEGPSIPPRP